MTRPQPRRLAPGVLALAAACGGCDGTRSAAPPSIRFDDVTAAASIENVSRSFGVAVGDFDGDGWDDVFLGNHYHGAGDGAGISLFHNRGGRSFENVAASVFGGATFGDLHGAEWIDFDSDGDEDLHVLTGSEFGKGAGNKLFFVNAPTVDGAPVAGAAGVPLLRRSLTESAAELGLDEPLARGRTPLWLPTDDPRRLDVLVAAIRRPDGRAPTSAFHRTASGRFEGGPIALAPLPDADSLFAELADLDGDGSGDLVLHEWQGPAVLAVGTASGRAHAPAIELPEYSDTSDFAIADFDGDLLPDLLVVGSREVASVDLVEPARLEVAFVVKAGVQSISFACDAQEIHVRAGDAMGVASIAWIGTNRRHPKGETFVVDRTETIDPAIRDKSAIDSRRLWIGFDSVASRWIVAATSREWWGPVLSITAASAIREVESRGFTTEGARCVPALMLHEGKGKQGPATRLVDASSRCGLRTALSARSVVAGDFDDDGDVDAFIVQSTRTVNLPDVVLENLGHGVFRTLDDGAGAAGIARGYGDTAVVLDYDRDGFLDLLVTNGEGSAPDSASGPLQLFHNRGNTNHWLEIDLEGTVSNRDAIGARVRVDAGGLAQLREQGGGMHRFSQDSKRLHFGLGSATRVDRVVVRWPSGIVQTLGPIEADRILAIREPSR